MIVNRFIALVLACLISSTLILSCSDSKSPVNPSLQTNQGSNLQSTTPLQGIDIVNSDLLAIKLNGTNILPWAMVDMPLAEEGTFPLEIIFARSLETNITLMVDGAQLLANDKPVEKYVGKPDVNFKIASPLKDVKIHFRLETGSRTQTRDIVVRTKPTIDLPIPESLGTVNFYDPESNLSFDIAKRELLVGIQKGIPITDVETLMNALDCEILREIPGQDVFRIRIPEEASYSQYISMLEESPIVRYAEVNSIHYLCLVPNDTYHSNEYEGSLCKQHEAWDITTGDNTTIVAVIDSGIMRDHPDLAVNVINGEDFISPIGDGLGGETAGDGLDNNGDGVADQNVGHGTHCGGIIGAVGNNGEGVSGHSWHTKLLPLRVFPVNGDDGAMSSAIIEAIGYAVNNGATCISLSLGSPYSSTSEQNAINNAWNNGVVIIAAAGNSGVSSKFYPAAYNNVVAVAATNNNDIKASWSNYGTWVDVCAPGVEIISSIFYTYSGNPYSVPENQRYAFYNGTSMACPQVSGLVALVASYFPDYTQLDLVNQVIYTADNIDAKNPNYVGQLGSGRINDYRALISKLAPDFTVVSFASDDDNPLYSQGNRDGFLNPGETIEISPTIRNEGLKPASSCYLSLIGDPGKIDVFNSQVSLGYIDINKTVTPANPLIFRVAPGLDNNTPVTLTLRFEYQGGDPIEVPISMTVRKDLYSVDIVTCTGESLLGNYIAKGSTDLPLLKFNIETSTNYATLDELYVYQSGTAAASSFNGIELWLDSDNSGTFSALYDTRVAYRSYDHPGFRGSFDDLNDSGSGLPTGIDYETFPQVNFDGSGVAHFHDIFVPTVPGVPRSLFIVTDITAQAISGTTVKIGILSAEDVKVRYPDNVNPVGFPIQTEEVPIIGTWLDPIQVTDTPTASDARYSWRPETAVCPVTGNLYFVFDSNRNGNFDVFIQKSTDQGATFEPPIKLDPSTANEYYPDVQVDSTGTVHIVYHSTQISNNNREIFYVRSKDFGNTYQSPVRLTNAIRDSRLPKLAIGPDNSLNVAWHDDRVAYNDYDIYFMKSTNGGDTWGTTVQVCDTNPQSTEAAIAVGGDGAIHITWEEPSGWSSGNVYYSRSTNGGTTFSSPFQISSGSYNNRGLYSDVAADKNGRVYVVFHYLPGGGADTEIACRISSDSGATWNPVFLITDNTVPDSRPGIYAKMDGSFVDIVFRRREANIWNIFHTYSENGMGSYSTPVKISLSLGGDARSATVVRAPNNNIFAFWEDVVNSQGNYEVFFNRFIY